MFVQWCIKGISGRLDKENNAVGIDKAEAEAMIKGGEGIVCNLGRKMPISPADRRKILNYANLDRHIHDYENFKNDTPFISLTAGCVERDTALKLNRIHEAEDVALRFATNYWERPGYIFYCWVVVGLKPAVSVEAVAEEMRELNTYLSYSDYQLEGEITAKFIVPANQILRCELWDFDKDLCEPKMFWSCDNTRFDYPAVVSNVRGLL
jgi:hypothetical protein